MTEGPCASLAFCRGLDLELLVEDLWGAGRGPGSALQGPPGLRLAGPEGRCGPRRSHARRGQSTSRAGRAGAVATSPGTDGTARGARRGGVGTVPRGAWCAVTPPTVTPAPCTRQGRKRGPLAGLAVTSRSAERGTWRGGRARQAGLQTRESRRQRLAAPARSGHRSYRCIELMASLHVIAGSDGQVVVTLIGLISQTGSRAAAPRFRAGPGRVCWGKAVAAV